MRDVQDPTMGGVRGYTVVLGLFVSPSLRYERSLNSKLGRIKEYAAQYGSLELQIRATEGFLADVSAASHEERVEAGELQIHAQELYTKSAQEEAAAGVLEEEREEIAEDVAREEEAATGHAATRKE